MPAILAQVGDRERRDGNRADAFLGSVAGVAGEALDFDRHPIAAGRADLRALRRAAIEIERQRGLPSLASLHEAGAKQADFLLDGPQKRERRVRQLGRRIASTVVSRIAAPDRSSAPSPVSLVALTDVCPCAPGANPRRWAPCLRVRKAFAADRGSCRAVSEPDCRPGRRAVCDGWHRRT